MAAFSKGRSTNQIRLGAKALLVEHVGSTCVPGSAAKSIIDILLVVIRSRDEVSNVPELEASGYILRIREPDWHEHRLFKGPDTNINLHILVRTTIRSSGCCSSGTVSERAWKIENIYLKTKRELAAKNWKYVQNYAVAKSAVVEGIIKSARPTLSS